MVLGLVLGFARDPDHADDLFQEIWTKVYLRRRSFRGTGSFEAWLFRVAESVCQNDYRARRSRLRLLGRLGGLWDVDGPVAGSRSPLQDLEADEARSRLHRAMARLTPRELEAVTLRVVEGRSAREVADIMRIQVSTVRSILRHAIQRMRGFLVEEGS
jgi:RNA polymerase sigma-70 factor (ECF subfamily)